jgi:uncharacterized protein YqfA (UPF0365 family)
MQNIKADTDMRDAISGTGEKGSQKGGGSGSGEKK